jgi:hypothetical protein
MNFYFLLFLFFTSVVLIFVTLNRIYEKYVEDDPMLIDIRHTLYPVFPDINGVVLLKGKKSYTINKKKVHICLKDEKGNYYDKNMLIYVTLHELAHVRCDEVGHTEKFHRIFQGILDTAIEHKIYNPSIPIIKNYCEY